METSYTGTRKCLRPFAIMVCCLIAAHVMGDLVKAQPRGIPPLPVPQVESKSSALSKTGPQFVAGYLLNNISATVLAKAAPMVVEYQLGNESTATITLTVTIKKQEERFTRQLKRTGAGVQQEVFQLPETFGNKPVVAALSVKAENVDPTNNKPPDFELFSLGLGERAVGSLKIDRLSFEPDHVSATQKMRVRYSFHSLADFDNASVEFRILGRSSTGEPANGLVNKQKISGGLRRDESKRGEWDGKDQKGKVSKGLHILFVAAWFEEKKGGDWNFVSDPSRQRVKID